MSFMKQIYFSIFLSLLFLTSLSSQELTLNKGIGVRKTFLDFNSLHEKSFDAFREYSNGMEIFFVKKLKNNFSLILPIGIATLTDSLTDYSIDPVVTLGAQAQYNLLKKEYWVNPYLIGGVNAGIPKLRDFYVQVPLGLGVHANLHPQVKLQWQSDYRLPLINGKSHLQHSIGILYMLGNTKTQVIPEKVIETETILDSDGDGIADRLDLCPSQAGLKDFSGCPDTDKDGVADKDDRCPETAGNKKLNGCPDADEDGISDPDDECPNIKGTKANKGCPDPKDLDTDGDGVLDKNDYCPEISGSKNAIGCPDRDNDGIADKEDRCPDIAGVKSKGGCPDPKDLDTDGDGINDKEDNCPDVKGTSKNKGCPEKEIKPESRDTDNDGVTDDKDLCPDKAGLFSTSGCPDSDGDGVADKDDRCPSVAGIKSNGGCPEVREVKKDSDGDGFTDDIDECPFAAGVERFNGCPDSDGDGVHDKIDKCPKAFGPSTNAGCPEIERRDLEVLDYAMRAVQFDLSRSTLRPESFVTLDKIGDILLRYPSYNLIIAGHTDNTGNEAKNRELSERRAKVCMDYLISRGLPPGRLTYVGYGSSQPISDNKTDTGRFLNRRTEFSLVIPR
ncbi:MAG: OmpA family protein [Saprospiraceae bacterium]|nr:OmpA family protein [Saprospiraceae bacterium]